jgi:hypothetical protein
MWSTNSGRLMILLDLSPADFRRFLTVLVDRRLLGSQCCLSTGLGANGIRLTKGMSFKAIGCQMGYHYTVVSRLVRKHTQTNNVKDLPRSSRPRVTSDHDEAETDSRLTNGSILRHVLKFQAHRAKHHAKRVRRCRSTNSGRLMILLTASWI